jgi:hypothetical protein
MQRNYQLISFTLISLIFIEIRLKFLISFVFVECNSFVVINKLASGKGSPQCSCNRCVIFQVILTDHFLNRLRGFLGVIEGDLGKQVVTDVSVGDMVEAMVKDGTKRAIHSAKSAT